MKVSPSFCLLDGDGQTLSSLTGPVQSWQEAPHPPLWSFTSVSRLGFLFLHVSCFETPSWSVLHLVLWFTFSTSMLPLVSYITKPKIKPVSSPTWAAVETLTVSPPGCEREAMSLFPIITEIFFKCKVYHSVVCLLSFGDHLDRFKNSVNFEPV